MRQENDKPRWLSRSRSLRRVVGIEETTVPGREVRIGPGNVDVLDLSLQFFRATRMPRFDATAQYAAAESARVPSAVFAGGD